MRPRTFFAALAAAVLLHLLATRLFPGFPRILDLFFLLTALNGLRGNSLGGLLGGMACGLTHDVFSGAPYGLHGFADTLVGYATARIAQRVATRRPAGLLLIVLSAAILQQGVLLLLGMGLMSELNPPEPLWLGLRALLSSLATLAMEVMSRRLQVRITEARRNRRSRLRMD